MKNRLPYYKAYPRDFIEGTVGMPFEIKCAYRVLLDLIYMQSGELPDDARYISGLLGCSIRKWKIIREYLIREGKIIAENEIISNFRARLELEILSKLQDKQSENRSRPNKINDLQSPRCDQPEPEPEPEPENNSNELLNARYFFKGEVIQLTKKDYDRWKQSYFSIPDFHSSLQAADDWMRGQPDSDKKRWFHVVSGVLNNKHQKFVNDNSEKGEDKWLI